MRAASDLRFAIAASVLLGGILLLHAASRQERVPLSQPLEQFPMALDGWKGQDQPLEARIVKAVGVDDYLNRMYQSPDGHEVQLYVGYYRSQQTGDTIHSPRNCLPGNGWTAVRSGRLVIPAGDRRMVVNEYIVENGLQRDLVLYWYQSQGRSVASEYSAKFWMVADAVSRDRTDGALVRIWTPITDGEDQARARAVSFAQGLAPEIGKFVPD